jgi:hypothetical protein
VTGDVESTSCSCFCCSRSLRVHSVEGVSKGLRLLYVVFLVSVNGSDKTVQDGEIFRFLGMGHTWSSASVPPPFLFFLWVNVSVSDLVFCSFSSLFASLLV